MFKKRRSPYNDLSRQLRDVQQWNPSPSTSNSRLEPVSGICTLSADTHSQLFAVGTLRGEIRVYDEQFKETILVTPRAAAVKSLQFVRSKDMFKLLCIDGKNMLHAWNLDVYGHPVLVSRPLDGPTYRISTCLSHRHALLASQSGDVLTYNLRDLRTTSYKIPHSFGDRVTTEAHGPAIDVAMLPYKLNHVIIGYEGGAVLYDLVARKVLSTYSQASESVTNGSTLLTTIALHPLGRHFATGHEDGTICLWYVQSSEPLWVGSARGGTKPPNVSSFKGEPIFKLEWTFIKGQTDSPTSWLTVLGGLHQFHSSDNGISVLSFDASWFQGRDAVSPGSTPQLWVYPFPLPPQDFAIIPAKVTSPNGHGCLIVLSGEGTVAVDAFEFPPQPDACRPEGSKEGLQAVEMEFSAELEESEERSRHLAATLDDFSEEDSHSGNRIFPDAPRVSLPFPLLVGDAAVSTADLVSLHLKQYLRLVRRIGDDDSPSGKDRYRILVTLHADSSLRFHDVSAFADGADLSLHPVSLGHLTFRVLEIPEIALRPDIPALHTVGFAFAPESLECAVQLSNGDVVVLGLGMRPRTQDVMDEDIIDLSDVRDLGDLLTPRFILRSQNGGVDVVSLSDIGFLAVAFKLGLLVIVDLRGPKVFLRDTQDAISKHGEPNTVQSLSWCISGVGEDTNLAPRLLAFRHDGLLTTFSLSRSHGVWGVDKSRTTREAYHGLNASILSVVVDAGTGMERRASPAVFTGVAAPADSAAYSGKHHSFWVAATRKKIRCGLDISGDDVAKLSFSSRDFLDYATLVSAHGASVLVTFAGGRAIVYSVPSLDAVYTVPLPIAPESIASICCTSDGDMLYTCESSHSGTVLVFTSLLAHPGPSASGVVNFRVHKYAKVKTPAALSTHPQEDLTQTWGSSITSWIKTFIEEETFTGDDIDTVLAGSEVHEAPVLPAAVPSSDGSFKGKKTAEGTVSSNWGQGMYQQLTSAAAERGERLGQLEEHFKSLESGSKDMVSQAKKLAEKQAAKRWFL